MKRNFSQFAPIATDTATSQPTMPTEKTSDDRKQNADNITGDDAQETTNQ